MAEFQWWLLLVGLVAGGGLVAVVSMEGRRREEDVSELEQRAEATWIADGLTARGGRPLDPDLVEGVLRAHRRYLSLQAPDRLLVDAPDDVTADLPADVDLDRDADGRPDEVGHGRRRRADEDLATATEQRAAAREQAHAGPDRE
jgi:hypothetical protein